MTKRILGLTRFGKMKLNKRYLIYHLRWQFSGVVMLPFMMMLEQHLPLWQNLAVGSFIGAAIFWFVDKKIFHTPDKENNNG